MSRKKTLICTNHFYPEVFRVNDVAFDLAKRGDEVTVITCVPNYPHGQFHKGYGWFKRRKEIINGVKVIRVPVIPRGNGGGIRLFTNYLSYLISACITALYLALTEKFDRVFVHETSPVTVGVPAVIVKKIQRIPLFFWVLDLWPESLSAAGGINNKIVLNFFEKIVKFLYRNSDKILMSSRGFEQSILEKGDFQDKLIYFPNWGEDIFEATTSERLPKLPEGFKIMYAGNIGEAQDFEAVMEAAKKTGDNKSIKWILIGDGRKRPWIEQFIHENNLHETVHLLGRYPIESMPGFFQQADLMLMSLKDELIFNLTVPAKLQAYMAAKKPIIAMINGEGAEIIRNAKCGAAVNAGEADNLSQKVMEYYHIPSTELASKGSTGYEYYKKTFDREICLKRLKYILN